jgi:hypothetical protein
MGEVKATCLACDEPMPIERARNGMLCETCTAVLGTPEEAAKSFAWAAGLTTPTGAGRAGG